MGCTLQRGKNMKKDGANNLLNQFMDVLVFSMAGLSIEHDLEPY